MVLVLVGVAGAGKTHLRDMLGLNIIKTYTTRKKRESETLDDYNFVTLDEFQKLMEEGTFFETVDRGGYFYGSPKDIPDGSVIVLDYKGAWYLKDNIPNVLVVGCYASLGVCTFRLSCSEPERKKRLDKYNEEMGEVLQVSDIVINTERMVEPDVLEMLRKLALS